MTSEAHLQNRLGIILSRLRQLDNDITVYYTREDDDDTLTEIFNWGCSVQLIADNVENLMITRQDNYQTEIKQLEGERKCDRVDCPMFDLQEYIPNDEPSESSSVESETPAD